MTSQGASSIARAEHSLFRIVGARLGDADMAHLALFLELDEGGRQDIAMMLVGGRGHGVEMEDVHVVETQPPQRRLHLAGHRLAGIPCAEDGFGRDHQLGAVIGPDGGADDLLGAIGLGGVEEIDAEIDGRPHDRHAVVEARAAAEAEPAVAAAPEPGDADREAGLSERPVFHHRSFIPQILAAALARPSRDACSASTTVTSRPCPLSAAS